MADAPDLAQYVIAPDPKAPRLTRAVTGTDHLGQKTEILL